eukprot:392636_1
MSAKYEYVSLLQESYKQKCWFISNATYFKYIHANNTGCCKWFIRSINPVIRDGLRIFIYCLLYAALDNEYSFILLLFIMHIVLMILIAFGWTYSQTKWDHIKLEFKHNVGACCMICTLFQFLFGLCMGFIMIALPTFSYNQTVLSSECKYGVHRFDGFSTNNKFLCILLEYIMNCNNIHETKRRIIALNYYFTPFKKYSRWEYIDACAYDVTDNAKTRFHDVAQIHNQNIDGKLSNLNWSDMRYTDTKNRYHQPLALLVIWTFLLIYNLLVLIVLFICNLHVNNLTNAQQIFVIISFIYECICVVYNIRYSVIYWYCYHLVPFITTYKRELANENQNVDDVMENIETLYQIMFFSAREIESVCMVNHDVATIIRQYLWEPLPMHAYNDEQFLNLFYQMCFTDLFMSQIEK